VVPTTKWLVDLNSVVCYVERSIRVHLGWKVCLTRGSVSGFTTIEDCRWCLLCDLGSYLDGSNQELLNVASSRVDTLCERIWDVPLINLLEIAKERKTKLKVEFYPLDVFY